MGPYVCEFAIVIFSSFPKIFLLFRISSNKLTKYFPSPSIYPPRSSYPLQKMIFFPKYFSSPLQTKYFPSQFFLYRPNIFFVLFLQSFYSPPSNKFLATFKYFPPFSSTFFSSATTNFPSFNIFFPFPVSFVFSPAKRNIIIEQLPSRCLSVTKPNLTQPGINFRMRQHLLNPCWRVAIFGINFDISWAYLGNIFGISWANHRHIFGIFWPYIVHILGMSWAYLWLILGTYWAYS